MANNKQNSPLCCNSTRHTQLARRYTYTHNHALPSNLQKLSSQAGALLSRCINALLTLNLQVYRLSPLQFTLTLFFFCLLKKRLILSVLCPYNARVSLSFESNLPQFPFVVLFNCAPGKLQRRFDIINKPTATRDIF